MIVAERTRPTVKTLKAAAAQVQKGLAGIPIACLTLITYLFLFTPILVLIVFSFNASKSMAVWNGFTLDWYKTLLRDRYILQALRNSVIVGVTSATISTTIGTITALVLVRRRFPGKELFSTLMLSPLVLPEIVIGVAFLVFMVFLNIKLGFFTLITGHVVLTIPYSTLIVRASASGLDISLEEAAADLGANPWKVFRHITLPLLIPGVLTAFLLTFTISFDDFVISMFTAGVGTTTLPLRIFSMLKLGITPEINALGSLLILLNLVMIIAVGGQQLRKLMGGEAVG